MTLAQLTYPLLALGELTILVLTRSRQSQNAPALRLWLQVQLAIFCVLEPASFLSAPIYGRYFFACTLVSAAADLMVLYSLWYCLEDGFPAFGSLRAWSSTALLTGLLFCVSAGLRMPPKAHGIEIAWLTTVQSFTYVRALGLIVLSLYGWLRASSWPRDLAWTWLGMAMFSGTDAVVTRVQIISSDTNLFELVTTTAAVLQLVGWWRALSYVPKPLTLLELQSVGNLPIPICKGHQ
jgi:uncharacterized membrane protein YgdD (TMEM256/DUF423 family)